MATRLNPYLSFRDQARDAMTFYQGVFGGELTTATFAEYDASGDAAEADRLMHSMLVTPSGLVLMGADTPAEMGEPTPNGTVSLSGDNSDEAELRAYWDALSEGAMIAVPLSVAPWGDAFGMLTDRYDVGWLVNIAGPA
ncbi:VOC family protein [Mumia zhuanghuii]|uniref:VOC family protein n=1 Tax=Mumia zhuanghuii TaxID=2585211 RepID=UPI0036340409